MRAFNAVPLALVALACGDVQYQDAVTADPGHYAVEFENDIARVVRINYGPGERSVLHFHPTGCGITLGSTSWRMTDFEGTVTESSGALGDVNCGENVVHLPENTGSEPNQVILIEFGDRATATAATKSEYPGAVSADPEHYAVEFENDIFRVLRISYGPGEESVMHYHPANCSVPLGAARWRMTNVDGEVADDTSDGLGSVSCGDATVHLPANPTEDVHEIILIEFKGRERFQLAAIPL